MPNHLAICWHFKPRQLYCCLGLKCQQIAKWLGMSYQLHFDSEKLWQVDLSEFATADSSTERFISALSRLPPGQKFDFHIHCTTHSESTKRLNTPSYLVTCVVEIFITYENLTLYVVQKWLVYEDQIWLNLAVCYINVLDSRGSGSGIEYTCSRCR